MGLDVRLPIGCMLVVIGALLVVAGVTSDPATYRRSLGIDVDLWWGTALLVLGGLSVALARLRRGTGSAEQTKAYGEAR
jgi:hypothetical protein